MNHREIEKPIINGLENPTGKQIPVLFYERPIYNEAKSKELGRPVYENRVYVRKHYDNLTCYDNRAEESDFQQYARQYDHFIRNKKEKESGVPIGMLPGITPAEIKVCEDMGLVTVEKLAGCSGGVAEIAGELKDRAVKYLNQGNEIEELKAENAELRAELAKLKGKQNELTNNSSKRGRRNNAVREASGSDKQQQQGNEASA